MNDETYVVVFSGLTNDPITSGMSMYEAIVMCERINVKSKNLESAYCKVFNSKAEYLLYTEKMSKRNK